MAKTPERFAKFIEGFRNRTFEFTTFPHEDRTFVSVTGLRVFSFCKHHLLPYFGTMDIGYYTDGKKAGLSKFQRLADKFFSAATTQEDVTAEILAFLKENLSPDCIVRVRATHSCMAYRGVMCCPDTTTTTLMFSGCFKEPGCMNIFLGSLQ